MSDTAPGFQPFGYAGGVTDPTTGLVRFGARDYHPATTQWLSRDPVGFSGGTNHYTYADGDPINRIDPTGHRAIGCLADLIGLLGMIPIVGTVFDIASALLYLADGNWSDVSEILADQTRRMEFFNSRLNMPVVDIYDSSGRRVRYSKQGEFIGFLEP